MDVPISNLPLYYRYWGKARTPLEADYRDGILSDDQLAAKYRFKVEEIRERARKNRWERGQPLPRCHLLPYHSLDVAAVAHVLLDSHPSLARFFAGSVGLEPQSFGTWAVFLVALHDLGKFSAAFQNVIGNSPSSKPYDKHHATLGYLLWEGDLQNRLANSGVPSYHDKEARYWNTALQPLIAAVTGHHGIPPDATAIGRPLSRWFTPEDIDAAAHFARDSAQLFLGDRTTPKLTSNLRDIYQEQRMPLVSWWLAGFTVLCDWLGSNREFFGFEAEEMDLAKYWHTHALPHAKEAVAATGILPVSSAHETNFKSLFDKLPIPTPLQQLAADIGLEAEPQLFILEDVTGAGKTEAAYLLVHRLMAQGLANGFYVALPTMATANAMYERSLDTYQRLFDKTGHPSLVLAHGARKLVPRFTESVLPSSGDAESPYDSATRDMPAGHYCNSWLADNRKKALLAQAGIGTIDQALLAVLKSRHQSLRLFGLLGKVLVVDEVHACDDYVHGLLKELIAAHTAAGGSTVLLSATLPRRMREELAAAYRRGRRLLPAELKEDAYPLFTRISETSVDEQQVDTRDSVRRTLAFRPLHDESEALNQAVSWAASGQCVCWIRNTVDDATRIYEALAQQFPEEKLILFHARFALGDRLAIEHQVLDHFGPQSCPMERQGRIVIATQVVEQSLDLDFDRMISDLAPIDLLLQRAGRLHRHCRDGTGNRRDRDERGDPELLVLAPDPIEDAGRDWLAGLLPKQVRVYPRHDRLWLTAKLVRDRRTLRIHEDLREWMAFVYDHDTPVPEGIRIGSDLAIAQGMVDGALAQTNTIHLETGYRADREWWDEVYTPTRLGEATVTLRLARWDGEALNPWWPDKHHAWSYSEVNIRRRAVVATDDALPAALLENSERVVHDWHGSSADQVLIPLTSDNGIDWRGTALDPDGKRVRLRYDKSQGLRIEG